MVAGALFAVPAGNMPVVASGAFCTFASFVVAFSLAGVLADLTVEFYHRLTLTPSDLGEVGEGRIPFI